MKFTHIDKFQYPKLRRIDTPSGKRQYITPDGKQYPSITTILGSIEKPAITQWKNSMGHNNAQKEMERCAIRGTAVHKMAENYLNNIEHTETNYDYIKRFNQIKIHLNKINNVCGTEVSMYSDLLKVAGTCDCIAEYDGILSIIDFKTSTNIKTESIVQDYFLQCTAYALMFNELFDIWIDQIVVIISVEKGLPLLFKKSVDDYIEPLVNRIKNYK